MFCVVKLKNLIVVLVIAAICIPAAVAEYFAKSCVGEGTENTVDVPIIMYHSILHDKSKRGTYVITPDDLEADLRYLSENGYTAVFMSDLIHFACDGAELPKKPVVLTFDDGCYNNVVYALPLMEKYNMRFVISIVGEYTDMYTDKPDPNPNYAYLSWDDTRKAVQSGRIEIGNHTYGLHSVDKGRMGCKKKRSESEEEYRNLLINDIGGMQKKMEQWLGECATTFTYPFGGITKSSDAVIREIGFKASLTCNEGINKLSGNADELYMLKRCLRSDKRSVRDIMHENYG